MRNRLAKYLTEELREVISLRRSHSWEDDLPMLLSSKYELYSCDYFGVKICFAISQYHATPYVYDKEIKQIRQKTQMMTILVVDQLTRMDTRRLIERKLDFVVPGQRIYMPSLFIELGGRQKHTADVTITPAAQLTLLYQLQKGNLSGMDAQQVAGLFSISYLTASRAVKWINDNLQMCRKEGRRMVLDFPAHKELLDTAKGFMRTPVIKTLRTEKPVEHLGTGCGEYAMEHYSMLAAFGCHVAVPKDSDIQMIEDEGAQNSVEYWMYDPTILAEDGFCDRISLILSMNDNKDERVQMELQQIKREIGW